MSTLGNGPPARVRRRAVVVGGVCVALLAVVYLLAVWTPAGQRFEDAVLRAAGTVAGTAEEARAVHILDAIAAPSVIAAVILVLLTGVLRRRLMLGFLAVGVIAASILTAEILQRLVLRPVLLGHGYRREDQSFPSGHAAVAMSVMCALVMVVPYRFRGLVVFLSYLWAASVGVATVTASWHRPSDTIGSDLIVIVFSCAAVAVLARSGRVREAAHRTPLGRVLRGLLTAVFAGVAIIAFVVAAVVVGVAVREPEHTVVVNVLVAGRALALSGSAAVATTLLALLHGVELDPPVANEAAEGRRDGELRNAGVYRSSGT
jgi:PAP2 superfamily